MPLLPLEPFVFPEHIFSDLTSDSPNMAPWWALHTRPRAEKSLARRLLRRQAPFFLPICKRVWRNCGRTHCSFVPLFPGYVFLQGDNQAVSKTLETKLVARVLPVENQRQLHADLARVYCLIAAGAPLAPEERLQPGAIVEITSGPLRGLEGKILRRGKQLKLIVEVQFLQRGVSVEIESWMIHPRSTAATIANVGA